MINYKIKNKEVSLILCVLGGWFGLHHFYNKKIGLGILYFCTCGLFCIGWIIDIFKIISIKEEIEKQITQEIEEYIRKTRIHISKKM